MCLITTQKESLIAKRDKKVYKIMKPDLISPFQGFKYRYDKLYSTKIQKEDRFYWSCMDDVDETYLDNNHPGWKDGKLPELICIGSGIHSALTKKRLQLTVDSMYHSKMMVIIKCTIPKGSEYYLDATGLVVSNQIIINKPIKK